MLDSCNFACVYCTADDFESKAVSAPKLSTQQLLSLVKQLHHHLDLTAVRLTGGEPLLYRELELLIRELKMIGIPEVKMTTNGFLLKSKAEKLKKAGLDAINISLDAVEDLAFFKLTRRDKLQEVKEGIDDALNAGIEVKLNAVIMKSLNDDQIIPLLNYAKEKGVVIRYLELMNMGHLFSLKQPDLFTQEDILNVISDHHQIYPLTRSISSTANYWKTEDGYIFGIIANHSTPFCKDCDRLRIDQEGKIYGCLSTNNGIALDHLNDSKTLEEKLQKAMQQKQKFNFTGSNLSMLEIGG